MRDRLHRIDQTDTGLLLHFEPDPKLQVHLQQFILDEKGCCQFWGFEVGTAEGDLTLRCDGPPDVQTLIDELGTALDRAR